MTVPLPCPFCGDRSVDQGHKSGCWFSLIRSETTAKQLVEAWNRRASPWRPMSEAPTDNTEILIRDSLRLEAVLVRYLDGQWLDEHGTAFDPVAWMPIPSYEVTK